MTASNSTLNPPLGLLFFFAAVSLLFGAYYAKRDAHADPFNYSGDQIEMAASFTKTVDPTL